MVPRSTLAGLFLLCSDAQMKIRAPEHEIDMVIAIAITTAPSYALREVSPFKGEAGRTAAVDALTARIVASLRRYDLMRDATDSEVVEAAGARPPAR